jgi:hypothetical protein
MKNTLLIVTLGIAVFVFWLQLTLCVVVWQLAENVYEINQAIKINKNKLVRGV